MCINRMRVRTSLAALVRAGTDELLGRGWSGQRAVVLGFKGRDVAATVAGGEHVVCSGIVPDMGRASAFALGLLVDQGKRSILFHFECNCGAALAVGCCIEEFAVRRHCEEARARCLGG